MPPFLRGVRDDIENEDDEESYYRYIEENPNAGADKDDSDIELEYDEDGNPIAPVKSKVQLPEATCIVSVVLKLIVNFHDM